MVKLPQKLHSLLAAGRYDTVVAAAVLGVLIGAVLMSLGLTFLAPQTTPASQTTVQNYEVSNLATPVRLRVPRVGIDTTFEAPLGLKPDQSIEVPESYDQVAWYQHGPKPGELGPAVILGHVDSYTGPAVFHPLHRTKVGDTIEITLEDDSVVLFEITELSHENRSTFPTDEVYGDLDHAGLRLITCSGAFDRGEQVYSHNLIVFAKRI